jgi:hypothetical protein
MQDSQSSAEITCEFVNDVLERLQCEICEFAMNDPVQLQKPGMAIFTGCRKCITPIKKKCALLYPRPPAKLISLPAIKKELDVTATICTNCNKIMPRVDCANHIKHCKLKQTLSHCGICREFYTTTKLDVHERSEHHVRAVLEKTTADLNSLKHERESDDELPPAKRQKLASRASAVVPDHDEKKLDNVDELDISSHDSEIGAVAPEAPSGSALRPPSQIYQYRSSSARYGSNFSIPARPRPLRSVKDKTPSSSSSSSFIP